MFSRGRKRNKYGAVPTGGMASKLEYSVYQLLQMQEKNGEIYNIRCQHQVYLTRAKIGYKVDFSFERDGKLIFCEAKGMPEGVWMLKKRLWEYYGPGPLEIYMGNYRRPFLKETVYPK